MFQRFLGKVVDDLVCGKQKMFEKDHASFNTRRTELIGQALLLQSSKLGANTAFQNSNRPGLSATCCKFNVCFRIDPENPKA